MPEPISFPSTTPRLGLPLLFAGQAQKEFHVNEAHSLVDALLHGSIEGTLDLPPNAPVNGSAWIIGEQASGEWQGRAGQIACRQSGVWLYSMPLNGMQLFDKTAGQSLYFQSDWQAATDVPAPENGTTIDIEARSAIVGLITALQTAGILSRT